METITRKCRSCGREFAITPKQQQGFLDKKMKLPTRCIECRHKNREFIYKTCKECGTPFQISALNREWYAKQGFKEPEHCPECRRKRREARHD